MMGSAILLPLTYSLIGPLPLLPIPASRTQLILGLVAIGTPVAMACVPVLAVVFEVYRAQHNGQLPQWVSNTFVAWFGVPFTGGMWLGTGLSGLVASHASFAWSTGGVALAYLVQTVVCVLYCYWVEKLLNRGRGSDEEACGSQLGGE